MEVGDTATKTCRRCGIARPHTDFYVLRHTSDGLNPTCRFCHGAGRHTRESRDELHARYERTLRLCYGMTIADRDELLKKQGMQCGICGCVLSLDEDGKLCRIDHNHVTARVRGVLCQPCNVRLGKTGEDIDWLEGALRYLRNAPEYPWKAVRNTTYVPMSQRPKSPLG